jgi:hypothetical protein
MCARVIITHRTGQSLLLIADTRRLTCVDLRARARMLIVHHHITTTRTMSTAT